MRQYLGFGAGLVFLFGVGTGASAKPLLTNSQDSYYTACLRGEDSPDRLLAICGHAMDQSGIGQAQWAEVMVTRGWLLYDLEGKEAAKAVFEQALERVPNSEPAWSGLAEVEYLDSNYPAAAGYSAKALDHGFRATTLVMRALARQKSGEMSLADAMIEVDAALALEPRNDWILREKGLAYGNAGLYERAEEAIEAAYAIDPNNYYNLWLTAWILAESAQWDAALPALNRFLELDPEHMAALSYRALTQFSLGRYRHSLEEGERLVALFPDSAEGYVRIARAQSALGGARLADETLTEAEAQVGEDYYLIYWHAQLLRDDGRLTEAMAMLDRVFAAKEEDYFCFRLKAEIALEQGQSDLATNAAEEAVQLRPEDPWSHYLLAMAQVEARDYSQAIDTFEVAMARDLPQEEVAFFASRLMGRGQFLKAVAVRGMFPDPK